MTDRRKLPEYVKKKFFEMMAAGDSVSEACQATGVTMLTACRWRRAAGEVIVMGRPTSFDERQLMVFTQALAAGAAAAGASRAAGISETVGKRIAKDLRCGRRVKARPLRRMATLEAACEAPSPSLRLSLVEREEISLLRAEGAGVRKIARRLGRSPSTISRELVRGSGPDGRYRPVFAQRAAGKRLRRPRAAKLATPGRLRDAVAGMLAGGYSPEQISARLTLEHPQDEEMRVCAETIYQAIYVSARGGLRREVAKALRSGRAHRKPQRKGAERRGRIIGMVNISERPPEVEDRALPGDWEGDLIFGASGKSAVATLVERMTRFVVLGHLPGDHTAASVQETLVPLITGLPQAMRRSLTWDQGNEMASHLRIAQEAEIEIYFCDPRSPWQRGTCENTNGLLRQYLPKGSDLSLHSREELEAVADCLNRRPRKILGWLTPAEAVTLVLGGEVTVGGRAAELPESLKPLRARIVEQERCCVDG